MREQTLEYEQDRRHVYALIGPPNPAKDYRGEAIFTPNAAGGTDIRWIGSFSEVTVGVDGVDALAIAVATGFGAGSS